MKDSLFYGARAGRLGYVKLSDWQVQPTPGLTVKRDGRARFCYDAAGVLQEVYSYNACIFCRAPDGGPVVNLTKYGPTSEKHLDAVLTELAPAAGYMSRDRWLQGNPLPGARDVIGLGSCVTAIQLFMTALTSDWDEL